ncbi:MAG: heparinase II/III family protein [Caulobacterales bacterium]
MARPPRRNTIGTLTLLPRAVAGAAEERIRREWLATPMHRWSLGGPKPKGLAARPRDARPPDRNAGARLLAGTFQFHGEALALGGGADPWSALTPSRRFAESLHAFGWMGDLLSVGEVGAREALRLWLAWRRAFGRPNLFGWSGRALERRLFNQTCAVAALSPLGSEAEGALMLGDIARQARHLAAQGSDASRAAERWAAIALAGAALAGPAGERLLGKALAKLERTLPVAVLPDGVHADRSPQRGLELLFDLIALDDALSQRGRPAPVEVSRAIDRLTAASRFFALGDGRLAAFQGGEAGRADWLAAALALEDAPPAVPRSLSYGGYHRLKAGRIEVIADTGAPASGVFSQAACAQPAAIEVVLEGRRLVRGCAWSTAAPPGSERFRLARGASTLTLDDGSPGEPVEGFLAESLGARLAGGPSEMVLDRRETDDAQWLDITHDGWAAAFGLSHTRRLFLDEIAGELRGEDVVSQLRKRAGRRLVAVAIHFHLAPDVRASPAVDGKSVLIRAPGSPGWRLRSDAGETAVEASVLFEDGAPVSTPQVVLRSHFHLASGGRIRWKLEPAAP